MTLTSTSGNGYGGNGSTRLSRLINRFGHTCPSEKKVDSHETWGVQHYRSKDPTTETTRGKIGYGEWGSGPVKGNNAFSTKSEASKREGGIRRKKKRKILPGRAFTLGMGKGDFRREGKKGKKAFHV